jgi:rSAM/selenodomain-associated transferase 2
MKLSVIIPTFNESANIARLLDFLTKHGQEAIEEIIVVDGGSQDGTPELALQAGAKVLHCSPPSRAAQLNLGAVAAKAEVLYFVHADTLPPPNFAQSIEKALAAGIKMGSFRYQFDKDHWLLRINAWFTRFDFLWCQGGDKTFFIQGEDFAALGGYDEAFVCMEEYDFIRRARKKYAVPTISDTAIVSARKYERNSWLRVQVANLLVFNLFRWGMEPVKLRQIYKRVLRS